MPELAAHLERVAKAAREMAELAAFHEVTPMCPSIHSQVVERNVRYFTPILAAALAACAREALEKAAQACDALVKERRGSLGWYNAQRCADAVRALERAAGESK